MSLTSLPFDHQAALLEAHNAQLSTERQRLDARADALEKRADQASAERAADRMAQPGRVVGLLREPLSRIASGCSCSRGPPTCLATAALRAAS